MIDRRRSAQWIKKARNKLNDSRTCEATGQPGVLMKSIGGWLKTLNPKYAASTLHYGKYSIVNQPPSNNDILKGAQ